MLLMLQSRRVRHGMTSTTSSNSRNNNSSNKNNNNSSSSSIYETKSGDIVFSDIIDSHTQLTWP